MTETKLLTAGVAAPPFCAPDKDGTQVCLGELRGKWVVLYFYPKDNTSGCTLEAVEFTSRKTEIEGLGGVVLGVSADSQKSHCNFAEKHGLSITLISDPERKVLTGYGVWQLKKMYGKEHYGIVRSTFLIDPEGVIRRIWTNVKVAGHVEEVINELKELSGNRA